MRISFLIVLFSLTHFLIAQNNSFTVTGKVMDATTQEAMSYVNILEINSKRGTISNSEGFFVFENLKKGDRIQFSFIGFQELTLEVEGNKDLEIVLKPQVNLLNMVTILSDTKYLNELIQRCRKTKNGTPKTAKTYFSLASYYQNERVELLEAYYNGNFIGHDVEDLNLKKGRIALREKENRLFISSETSVVLCLYNSFKKDEYFPRNPLEMNRRKLDKYFDLSLSERYLSPEGRIIYVIKGNPKEDSKKAFTSTFWIDSSSAQLIRLKLDIQDASVHPFTSLNGETTLKRVDLSIRKNFVNLQEATVLKTMDFDYKLTYISKNGGNYEVKSEAVLYAYNFEESFTLPYFEFTAGNHEDYRNINASPYNEAFWKLSKEFTLNDDPTKSKMFLENGATLDNRNLFSTNSIINNGFFEHPYVFWSEKRIAFRPDNEIPTKRRKDALPANRYRLGVQIYLDYNLFNDSIYFQIATVFDPYKTYSFLPETPTTAAFINLYFDLMEIEKRKLEKQLKKPSLKASEIDALYENCKKSCELVSSNYFKQVQRGTNWQGMLEWNEIVKSKLGIDNIMLYQLSNPMETE